MKNSPTFEIVNIILRRGNEPGLITEWFDGMKKWADANGGPDASALRIWLAMVRPRPFYTAAELAKLWPALQLTLGLQSRLVPMPGANRLANELIFHRLPVLRDADGKPFLSVGESDPYFIVEHVHRWKNFPMTQEDFENVILNG